MSAMRIFMRIAYACQRLDKMSFNAFLSFVVASILY